MASPRKSPSKVTWNIPVIHQRDWNSFWGPVIEFLEPFSCALVPFSRADRSKLVIVEAESKNLSMLKGLLVQKSRLVIVVPISTFSAKKNLKFIDQVTELSRKYPCLIVSLDNRINAALLGLQIFSVGKNNSSKKLANKLYNYKEDMRRQVLKQKLRT